jgi:hypothetical protein
MLVDSYNICVIIPPTKRVEIKSSLPSMVIRLRRTTVIKRTTPHEGALVHQIAVHRDVLFYMYQMLNSSI